ncbi:hypothetical protein SNEBB_008335 [Seison nebaliae]|nr:hypothetical protein SNEBB_008335 [Seison nebaliae]
MSFLMIPYKRSNEQTFTKKVGNYFKDTVQCSYESELKKLDQLRHEALFTSSGDEKSKRLEQYLDQIALLRKKVPFSEIDVNVQFRWSDAFDKGSAILSGLRMFSGQIDLEELSVLFNLVSSLSELAARQNLDSDSQMKTAAISLQRCIGIVDYIMTHIHVVLGSQKSIDFSDEGLNLIKQILSAQTQEIFYVKANLKKNAAITSKIAAECGNLYQEAYLSCQLKGIRDFLPSHWSQHLENRANYFNGLSRYYAAEQCLSDKHIGEQIAQLEESLKFMKMAGHPKKGISEAQNKLSIIDGALAQAKKDNKFVYNDRIPNSVDQINKVSLVQPIQLKYPIDPTYQDLFGDVTSIALQQSFGRFNTKKKDVLQVNKQKLIDGTNILEEVLANFNLPMAIETVFNQTSSTSTAANIPQSIREKSAGIKAAGGIAHVEERMMQLPTAQKRNRDILNVCFQEIEKEEKEDENNRKLYGDRWNRTPSQILNGTFKSELNNYKGLLEAAGAADELINKKYLENSANIRILEGGDDVIASQLPIKGNDGVNLSTLSKHPATLQLKSVLDKIETLKAERSVTLSELESLLSKNCDMDILNGKLSSAIDEQQQQRIIDEEVDQFIGPILQQVKENVEQQAKFVNELTGANEAFVQIQKELQPNSPIGTPTDNWTAMANSANVFNELMSHLNEGTKFYTDMTDILLKCQTKVLDFVFARRTEKEDLEKQVQNSFGNPTQPTGPQRTAPPPPTNQPPYGQQQQQQQYPQQYPQQPGNPYYPNSGQYPPYNPGTAYPQQGFGVPPSNNYRPR